MLAKYESTFAAMNAVVNGMRLINKRKMIFKKVVFVSNRVTTLLIASWLFQKMRIFKKLKPNAMRDGINSLNSCHCSAILIPGLKWGTWISSTRRVQAIAKTPSVKNSSRLEAPGKKAWWGWDISFGLDLKNAPFFWNLKAGTYLTIRRGFPKVHFKWNV